uniref:Ig-like domain-containing protein n=1 Tax=Ursus americanus TaxID=9643 RepID=A0A452QZE8_URSAM
MMTTQRDKRPEVTLACLLLATAGCFADLDQVPQVSVQPSSTVQKLGGTVILGCVVEPPWMKTTWRLNGKELNGSDDALGILITRGTLVITALSNHTVGRYQCVARMPAGAVASVPATVTLASECCSFAPGPRCTLFLPPILSLPQTLHTLCL